MKELKTYIRAGYSCIVIQTHEEQRVEAEIDKVASELGFSLWSWTCASGVISCQNEDRIADTESPIAMMDHFSGMPAKSLLIARDLHPFLGDQGSPADPMLVRKMKDAIRMSASPDRFHVMVVIGCRMAIPPEIEKMVAIVEFSLPDRDTLSKVLDQILESANQTLPTAEKDSILDAAKGLTTIEAANAFSLSFVEKRKIDPEIVSREKTQAVKKGGLLEITDKRVPLSEIGGLEYLKQYLVGKRRSFTREAREYGIPSPRGVLVIGQPGTGKSLTSIAASSILGIPLLSLDSGRLFDSLVGGTERNWRAAFQTAKACAPCIFRIDEVDGLMSGMQSSGKTDGGTTSRVIKSILTCMQEDSEGIFYFFTANDIENIPDALLSRLDVFYVDYPSTSERKQIWDIHFKKRGRNCRKLKINTEQLAYLSEGYSGRQIEQVVIASMEAAFNDKEPRQPIQQDVENVISVIKPDSALSTVAEDRRRRLRDRARPASVPEATQQRSTGRSLIA